MEMKNLLNMDHRRYTNFSRLENRGHFKGRRRECTRNEIEIKYLTESMIWRVEGRMSDDTHFPKIGREGHRNVGPRFPPLRFADDRYCEWRWERAVIVTSHVWSRKLWNGQVREKWIAYDWFITSEVHCKTHLLYQIMSDICHSIVISFYITIVVIPLIPLSFFFFSSFFFYSYTINCTHESVKLKIGV